MVDWIVTVHGTNDGASDDTGTKWWQLGSPFIEELKASWIGEPEIAPFHWSGANSQRARNRASKDLVRFIREKGAGRDRVFIVAHSHGGNVAADAVRRGLPGKANRYSIVTVGTPFLELGVNAKRQSANETAGTLVLNLIPLGPLASLFDLVPNLGIRDGVRAAGKRLLRFTRRTANPDTIFRRQHAAIYHEEDEAIAALTRAFVEGGAVAPKGFAIAVLSRILFHVALAALVIWGVLVIPSPGGLPAGPTARMVFNVLLAGGGVVLVSTLLNNTLIAPFRTAAERGFSLILAPLDGVLRRILDGLFHDILRSNVYGADDEATQVASVSALAGKGRLLDWRPLPNPVNDELVSYCAPFVLRAWHNLRRSASLTDSDIEGPSRSKSVLSDFQLSWRELLHTSYFDVPVIQRIIVFALLERAHPDRADAIATHPGLADACAAYQTMRPPDGNFRFRILMADVVQKRVSLTFDDLMTLLSSEAASVPAGVKEATRYMRLAVELAAEDWMDAGFATASINEGKRTVTFKR